MACENIPVCYGLRLLQRGALHGPAERRGADQWRGLFRFKSGDAATGMTSEELHIYLEHMIPW